MIFNRLILREITFKINKKLKKMKSMNINKNKVFGHYKNKQQIIAYK